MISVKKHMFFYQVLQLYQYQYNKYQLYNFLCQLQESKNLCFIFSRSYYL
uniref:Uncharacterized protein n=1 Tax=Meloidogyne enterolobii TaxID=390850 RepID=A0A6V7W330_MELEN|nr:unnamed protein product [Meloidogyne enterolobii]